MQFFLGSIWNSIQNLRFLVPKMAELYLYVCLCLCLPSSDFTVQLSSAKCSWPNILDRQRLHFYMLIFFFIVQWNMIIGQGAISSIYLNVNNVFQWCLKTNGNWRCARLQLVLLLTEESYFNVSSLMDSPNNQKSDIWHNLLKISSNKLSEQWPIFFSIFFPWKIK